MNGQPNAPPEVQQKLQRMEEIQEMGNRLAKEKGYINNQLQGIELAMERLKSLEDERKIFELVGPLIIELEDKEDAREQLDEEVKQLKTRLQELEEQDEDMRQMYQDLQEEVQQEMGQ